MNKKCTVCNKQFYASPSVRFRRFCCSLKCRNKSFEFRTHISVGRTGTKLNEEHKKKIRIACKNINQGRKHPQYIGNKVGYSGVHCWLRRKNGSATHCTNRQCRKPSKRFDYALIHGKNYSRNRSDYTMLCRRCHIYYDRVLSDQVSHSFPLQNDTVGKL